MPNVVISIHIPNPQDNPVKKLKKLDEALGDYLRGDAATLLKKDYKETVSNWRGAPSFPSEYSEVGDKKTLKVFPKGRNTLKWQIISGGTGPRTIHAKKKNMVFPIHHTPKTTPSGKYGGPGKKFGPLAYRSTVRHSIAPRQFSILIKKKREEKIIRDVEKVVRRSLR